jgi:ABC-type molybdenum transport system ATPase subunit/photorepair protein PhrA
MPAYATYLGLRRIANRKVCLLSRAYTTQESSQNTVLHIPTANVYRFGDPNNARPVFSDLQWTVKDGESWAVVGSGSGEKSALFQVSEHYSTGPRFQKAKTYLTRCF